MRAFFLVAFFSFLRISNLVPYKLSDIGDPQASFIPQGALLRITRTKKLQFRERVLEIPLPLIPGLSLCPVTALRQFLAHVPLSPSSPLFVCQSRGSFRPILAHQYNAFIKKSLSAIGFNPAQYSSHSFRRGGTTFAFCN